MRCGKMRAGVPYPDFSHTIVPKSNGFLVSLHGDSGKNSDNIGMPKQVRPRQKTKPRHFIKAWRQYRHLTQEQLAERIGVTPGNVSHLENGHQNYTQPMLEAIADALQCTPADLLMRNPAQSEMIWSIWENLEQPEKIQAVKILETFRKTGS